LFLVEGVFGILDDVAVTGGGAEKVEPARIPLRGTGEINDMSSCVHAVDTHDIRSPRVEERESNITGGIGIRVVGSTRSRGISRVNSI
jgi:hypothetical protein